MSQVVSLRLRDAQAKRLERVAARLGRTRSQAAAVLLEEAVRREEFGLIEFRSTTTRGREAFLHGTRIKAWQLISLAGDMGPDPDALAAHLGIPVELVRAGLAYADAFPDEIQAGLAAQDVSLEDLKRLLPGLEVFTIDAATS
jgi:uncharacterized protein (DUF433 family)